MATFKNHMSKTRKVDEPYMVWQSRDGSWEWRVLKAYQAPENELKNPYARWYCAVRSPFTYGEWAYGDTFCADIKNNSICVVPFNAKIEGVLHG